MAENYTNIIYLSIYKWTSHHANLWGQGERGRETDRDRDKERERERASRWVGRQADRQTYFM
jgi:hypothetical protein